MPLAITSASIAISGGMYSMFGIVPTGACASTTSPMLGGPGLHNVGALGELPIAPSLLHEGELHRLSFAK